MHTAIVSISSIRTKFWIHKKLQKVILYIAEVDDDRNVQSDRLFVILICFCSTVEPKVSPKYSDYWMLFQRYIRHMLLP